MALSKHEDGNHSLAKELEQLDGTDVLLDGLMTKPSTCYRLAGTPPRVIYNTNCPDDLKNKVEAILLRHRNNDSAVSYFYTIAFDFGGQKYTGRLTPAFKKGQDLPSSWHVVLNEVFFGHLHKDGHQWEVDEQRSPELVEKVGSLIDSKAYTPQTV